MRPTQVITDLIRVVTGPTATQELRERPRQPRRHPLDDTLNLLARVERWVRPYAIGATVGFVAALWVDLHTVAR